MNLQSLENRQGVIPMPKVEIYFSYANKKSGEIIDAKGGQSIEQNIINIQNELKENIYQILDYISYEI